MQKKKKATLNIWALALKSMQTQFQSMQWPVFQLLSTQNKHIIASSVKQHSYFLHGLLILQELSQKKCNSPK